MYLGFKLDVWLGSEPWLLAGGALFGVSVAVYSFWRRVIAPERNRSDSGQ